jgi:hypothetical protein
MTDWGYWQRRKPQRLRISASSEELAHLLAKTLPYLEWINRQSPWPLTLVLDIKRAIGLQQETEK